MLIFDRNGQIPGSFYSTLSISSRGDFKMKRFSKIMTAAVLTAVLGLTACTTGGESTTGARPNAAKATRTTAGSSLSDQARDLGSKARSTAEDALEITRDFLSGLTDQEIDEEAFRTGWENLKTKLQEMAANADTEEARQRINDVTADLEARVNDILTKISSNEGVQEIKTAISDFWTDARDRLAELMR